MKPPRFTRSFGSWLPVTLLLLLVVFASCFGAADDIQPNSRQSAPPQHQHHKVPAHQQHQHEQQRGSSSGTSKAGSRSDPAASTGSDGQSPTIPAGSHQDSPKTSSTGGGSGSNRMLETRNSYAVLSQAMSQAVHHEFGMYHGKRSRSHNSEPPNHTSLLHSSNRITHSVKHA